ncbi:MAG: trigger factor [Clostridia bacterium]|nr:trigger factor [Clostridia bacterium]MBQ4131164.1 trigger factor [Clostridia bacterium]
MSLKTSNKVDTNRYELEILIDGEAFRNAILTVYKREKKNISVQGFRKGKAPLSIIEKYYGEGVFFEDALNLLYADAIDAAAKEAGLTVIEDEMKFDLVSISKEDGVDFKVTLTTKPEVEVSEYKGLEVEKLICEVSDDEVKAELDRMADRNSRMVTVEDRAAELGDTAVIDFEGFVDGTAFDGGKGEGYALGLGSGQFIPGFEEQIVGHKADDEFDVNVKFPEEYGAKELAGKDATFKVKLHEIKTKELPEIDDEFAKDVSEFDTLDELKADIKAKALERKVKSADDDVENQIIDKLNEGLKAEIPEAMFRSRVEQSIKDFDYRLQMQGMNLQTYMQYMGGSVDALKENFRPQAERQVKIRLALEKIVELEKIEVSAEELDKEFGVMAETYSMPVEQIKAAVPAEDLAADLAVQKAMALVKENAKITEVKEYSKKEEEKKPAAKKTTKKAASADGEKKATAKKPAAKKTTTAKKTAKAEDAE